MKTNELKKCLELVKPGLASKELIEQSTCFIFDTGRVYTYNDLLSVSCPVSGIDDLSCAVQATELYKLIAKLTKEDTSLSIQNNNLMIKSGKISAGLAINASLKLPIDDIPSQGKWKKLPQDFCTAVKLCSEFCSDDMSAPIFACVHVRRDGKVESSDRYRICQTSLENELQIESFLIPGNIAGIIENYKPTHIKQCGSWVHFMNAEKTTLACRVLEDEFPQIDPMLEEEGTKITLPNAMIPALERAEIFSDSGSFFDEEVQIKISGKVAKITKQSANGWIVEEIDMEKEAAYSIDFSIHPTFLKDVLKKSMACELMQDKIKFTLGSSKIVISLPAPKDDIPF